ncbi:hypothetical protein OKW40_005102 [Paraburkholderia sp. RAU6.4a]|uniref:hypothetical protein n=1 Tax=unclassified Paraburkholderia TaxID=2615204 RepID=UPI003D1C1015
MPRRRRGGCSFQLAADYDEAAKPLAAVYAQRTDITAAERAIYSRVIEAGNKATPFIDEVIARQTSGDTEGARGAKSMTRVSSKRFRSARSAR